LHGLLDINKSSANGCNEIEGKEEDNEIGSNGFTQEEADQIYLEVSDLKDSLEQIHADAKES